MITPEMILSNDLWIADSFVLDVLLVDQSGQLIDKPSLTIVVDAFSDCIAGFHLSLDRPEARHLVSALRHAILQKHYDSETWHSWKVYGIPREFRTDVGRDPQSKTLSDFVAKLGIRLSSLSSPPQTSKTEKVFRCIQNEFFSQLPASPLPNHPNNCSDASLSNCLTLQELENLLIRYVCDAYNQHVSPRDRVMTRSQKWLYGFGGKLPEVVENC